MAFGRTDFTAPFAAQTATHDAAHDGVLDDLPTEIPRGMSESIRGLPHGSMASTRFFNARIGAEILMKMGRDESRITDPTDARQPHNLRARRQHVRADGFVKDDRFGVSLAHVRLQKRESYDSIESCKHLKTRDITLIIRLTNLRYYSDPRHAPRGSRVECPPGGRCAAPSGSPVPGSRSLPSKASFVNDLADAQTRRAYRLTRRNTSSGLGRCV